MMMEDEIPKGLIAYVREYKEGKRLVLLNFTGRKLLAPLFRHGYFTDAAGFQAILSTKHERPCNTSMDNSEIAEFDKSILRGPTVTLSPNEGLIIRVWSKRRYQ